MVERDRGSKIKRSKERGKEREDATNEIMSQKERDATRE